MSTTTFASGSGWKWTKQPHIRFFYRPEDALCDIIEAQAAKMEPTMVKRALRAMLAAKPKASDKR